MYNIHSANDFSYFLQTLGAAISAMQEKFVNPDADGKLPSGWGYVWKSERDSNISFEEDDIVGIVYGVEGFITHQDAVDEASVMSHHTAKKYVAEETFNVYCTVFPSPQGWEITVREAWGVRRDE